MWQYLCFCLLSLVFISNSAGSKDHQQPVHYGKDFMDSKEWRTDQMPTPCVHDKIAERNPHIVDLASQNVYMGEEKRQISPTYANIRIHPEFVSIHSSVDPYVRGPNSILSQVIKTLESVLMVHPVQGNLRIPPNCTEHTSGVNKGKCRSPLPSQSDHDCGEFGTIPLSYIGVREVCTSSYQSSSCTTQGPNGVGLPNTDYLLFVSASSATSYCSRDGVLAHASYCVLDSSDNNRPVVGHINICPSLIDSSYDIYSTILHEIIHALGFSIRLFQYYVGVTSNPGRIRTGPYGRYGIFKGPKAVRVAKSYYSCENIEGVALENEGTSNVATSHWEKRTLNNELMNGYISSDYVIFSEFTLALLEDSGWYKGNYTALSALNQRPLEWGRGLGCSFLTQRCVDKSVYPYLCDTRSVCTFDHLSKGTCYSRKAGFDDCSVAVADGPEDYCRTDMNITLKRDVESYGSNSICVDTIQSSSSCGNDKSILPLCVTQESFTINGSNQYVVYLGDDPYHCEDNATLVTADNWVVSCPPTEDIVSQSPVIKTELPDLSPANKFDGPQDRTCLSELYPFGLDHDDFTVPHSYEGDSSSPPIILAQAVQIFNKAYRKVYINDNGVISFGSPYNISTPLSFPLNGTDKIIAPYWADVDAKLRNIYYRQTTNRSLLTRANSEIRAAFPESQNVTIQNLLIATWYRVGYYRSSYDKTNTFQCVIATSGEESFVIFLYADGRIQWTTGDRSGGIDGLYGTEALAGINAGDGVNSITLPGSLTSGIINIAQTSNVGILGTWMFNFRSTAPNPPVILSVTTIDSQSVRVTWRAPTQPNGTLISYTITYNIDGGSFINVSVLYNGSVTQSYNITGLAPYQLVTVTITATNGGGTSGNSNEMTGRTSEIAPGIVQIDVNNSLSNTEVQVTWTPPEQPNGLITSYQVLYSVYESTTTVQSTMLNGNDRSYTIRNLTPGTPYQVRVVAYNSAGKGVLGDNKIFFSEELTPIKAPENIQATQLSATSVNVTWTPLTLFEAQGFPQYIVSLSPLTADTEGHRRRQANPTIITPNSFAVFSQLDADYSVSVSVTTGGRSVSVISSPPINISVGTVSDGGDDDDGSDGNDTVIITVGVVGGVLIIAVLITITVLVACYYRNRKSCSSPMTFSNKCTHMTANQQENYNMKTLQSKENDYTLS